MISFYLNLAPQQLTVGFIAGMVSFWHLVPFVFDQYFRGIFGPIRIHFKNFAFAFELHLLFDKV